MNVLVADESHRVAQWTMRACDGPSADPDPDEWWKKWRAPQWFFMKPFGDRPYHAVKAWKRMDQSESRRLLDVVEDRFNRGLIRAIGDVYLEHAKSELFQPLEIPNPRPDLDDCNKLHLSDLAQKGRDVLRIKDEMKRIKHFARSRRFSIREIETDHPNFLVWTFARTLNAADREVFDHPREWISGYANKVFLPKYYGRSNSTLKAWIRAFRNETKSSR